MDRPLPQALLLAVLLAGCGGSVAAAGGGGAAGSGAGGAGGGSAGSGGIPAGGGSAGVPAGGGAGSGATPAACAQTYVAVKFQLDTYDGQTLGCVGAATGQESLTGVVTDSKPDEFTIDSCPPNADCAAPMQSKLSLVDAPAGVAMHVPVGAFVEIDDEVQQMWGCIQRILVKNVPSWGGVSNSISTDPVTWLAANDGNIAPLPGLDLTVGRKALGCPGAGPGMDCGPGPADSYALLFDAGEGPMPLTMGQTGGLLHHGAGFDEQWTVENIRSYFSGGCDDILEWAWVLSPTQFTGH